MQAPASNYEGSSMNQMQNVLLSISELKGQPNSGFISDECSRSNLKRAAESEAKDIPRLGKFGVQAS